MRDTTCQHVSSRTHESPKSPNPRSALNPRTKRLDAEAASRAAWAMGAFGYAAMGRGTIPTRGEALQLWTIAVLGFGCRRLQQVRF